MTTRFRCSVCSWALAFGLCAGRAQTEPAWQDERLAAFNHERTRVGAPPFRLAPVLVQVAQQQAEEMARNGRRLRSLSSQAIAERLREVGYSAHDWRESIAFRDAAPEAVLASLPPAVDGRFRDLGIGRAAAGGFTLYVFLFGWHEGDFFASATAGLHDPSRVAAAMLSQVNEVRRRAGLPPFVSNPLLDRVSQEHAEDMLARSYFGHWTPEGLGPSDRARASGYRPGIGENLVEQRFSAEEALAAWMASPPHRRNLLDPDCREMGLGLAVGAGYPAAPGGFRVIWVQSVGRGVRAAAVRARPDSGGDGPPHAAADRRGNRRQHLS